MTDETIAPVPAPEEAGSGVPWLQGVAGTVFRGGSARRGDAS